MLGSWTGIRIYLDLCPDLSGQLSIASSVDGSPDTAGQNTLNPAISGILSSYSWSLFRLKHRTQMDDNTDKSGHMSPHFSGVSGVGCRVKGVGSRL